MDISSLLPLPGDPTEYERWWRLLTLNHVSESPIIPSWLVAVRDAAKAAGHIWPDFAACEAALESNWGESGLARKANNLFGMKQHAHPIFGTLALPTREFLDDQWKSVSALWVAYPSIDACFSDRMATLRRLAPVYKHYAAALAAQNGITYVREVSKSWSTDPNRAFKVLEIYYDHRSSLEVTDEILTQPESSQGTGMAGDGTDDAG